MFFAPAAVEDLRRAGDAVLHHAARVLADRVVDLRRRDAMAVLQHRVKGDAVVLLGQVLAGDADQQAMVQQRAIDAVMVLAPGQAAGAQIGDRFVAGPVPRANCSV